MIEASSIVLLQLQKTGGTHAERLMRTHLGATGGAKHRPLPDGWARDGRLVLGGVRNPWDWYVSYFAYGCERRGGITDEYLIADGFTRPRLRMARHRLRNVPAPALARGAPALLVHEARHRAAPWADLLDDARDVDKFRRFLARLLDPGSRFASAMDYGFSPHADRIGLFSYLYLLLYLRERHNLFRPGGPVAAGGAALDAALVVDRFLPMERLEAALAEALEAAGETVAANAVTAQMGQDRSNASKSRESDYRIYYDDETRDLVADRERLIIDRHGYEF